MAGSGYASYDNVHELDSYTIPLRVANEETLKGYARIVHDYEKEEVIIVTWPKPNGRPICPGTGNRGGITSGKFAYRWKGDRLLASNYAVNKHGLTTGVLPKGEDPKNRNFVLTREANYHPDGGQVVFSSEGKPFVVVLALPGDDVKLEDFVAFYFDGSFGMQMLPNVWHQPVYPLSDEHDFIGKQGAIFACVLVDTVDEFGKYLKVPLKPEFIEK